ncbi:ADP-ribose pyrophosphatase [Halobacteriales archaeon QS_1_68_20]|nr:MAG: ADP-ribose pyrophosphatase [Halobacteriales archaeon QS_1_68_20]
MGLGERSRERVRRALADLDDEFGVEWTVEDRWQVDPDDYDRTVERFEAGTVGGAGAWVRNDDGAVLLVQREGYDAWQEPSGKHEPGETLAVTARREVREETGVTVDLGSVGLAQQVEIVDAERDRPPLHGLVLVFHAEYAGGEVRPREGEIAAARWFDERPDELLYDPLSELPIPAD